MIAVDTSSFVAYLSGLQGPDVDMVDQSLLDKQVVFPPPVLTELLSDPKLPPEVRQLILDVPLLVIADGFWERAGILRAKILARGCKSRLADCLIAQNCIDHNVRLITRDKDFRHYIKIARLKIVSG